VFVIAPPAGPILSTGQLAMLDLRSGGVTPLGIQGVSPRYVPTGHLVYAAEDGSVRAVPFDEASLTVTGSTVPLLEAVAVKVNGEADFDVSAAGRLIYVQGNIDGLERSLVWVDRDGREDPIAAPPRTYQYPRLSPDGRRVALDVREDVFSIWVLDLSAETLTRLALGEGGHTYPTWTRDGGRIAYQYQAGADIGWKASNNTGVPEVLAAAVGGGGDARAPSPYFFTPDGTALVFRDQANPESGDDLVMISLEKDSVLWRLGGDFSERNAELSPDGRWMAYQSDESGTMEIYVRPFPDVQADQVQVSNSGGIHPLWSRDGRELFYLQLGATRQLVSVSVETGGTGRTFGFRGREVVMEWPYFASAVGRTYDVSPDGRFLAVKALEAASPEITVVLNWFEELRQRTGN
jgi:serine/threonine-protein kinase